MFGYYRLSDLKEIPTLSYVGYVRLSNEATNREVSPSTPFDFGKIGENPFIIEGHLFAEKEKISISIRHVDGAYIIGKVDRNEVGTGLTIVDHVLCGSGFTGSPRLKFCEAWVPKRDPLCEEMETLVPTWVAFTGFAEGAGDG